MGDSGRQKTTEMTMGRGLWVLPLALVFCATSSWAQDKPKKDEKAEEKDGDEKEGDEPAGGMMEDTARDPAETETFEDEGRFVPGRKEKKKKPEKRKAVIVEGAEEEDMGDVDEDDDDDSDDDDDYSPKKTKGVFVEALVGFGKPPLPGPELVVGDSRPDSTSYGFLIGAHFDVSTSLRLQLRVPWTTGKLDDRSVSALGVPELAGRLALGKPGPTAMALRLGIGIPIAQGNPDYRSTEDPQGAEQGILQRVASAANGWRDPELYEPKRLPVSPAFVIRYKKKKLLLGGEAKAVLLVKTGGEVQAEDADGGTYTLSSVGIIGFLGGDAAYDLLGKKYVGLRAWLAWRMSEPYDFESSATPPTPFQFVIEPRIFAKFGIITPSLGFLVPIGGQLGGEINGIRLHVNAEF
jgi:hypothetical protein